MEKFKLDAGGLQQLLSELYALPDPELQVFVVHPEKKRSTAANGAYSERELVTYGIMYE